MSKTYRIELVNRNNIAIEVAEDQPILDAIEQAGLRLPVGCRYGVCITCAAKLIEGTVAQPNARCLKPQQVATGYVLLCIAVATSDCKFEVGIESQAALYQNPFRGISA
jgi:ferredoxin